MTDYYEYLHIRVAKKGWRPMIEQLRKRGLDALESAGMQFYALWMGQIGMPTNEGIIMTHSDDRVRENVRENPALRELDGVELVQLEQLVATVRPVVPHVPNLPGVYMHRRFEVAAPDWPEFVRLSEEAWVSFEESFDANIVGLWQSQCPNGTPVTVHALLVTRYASFAEWERSRGENAKNQKERDTWQKFVRRHELTQHMVATAMELVHVARSQ
jgi:hypothetical protein